MRKFDNNDRDYFKWIKNHSSGFVVNTLRTENTKYFILHRPRCIHISKTGYKKGAYTERNYIKICSTDLNELRNWFLLNNSKFKGSFDECKVCNPLNNRSSINKNIYLFADTIDDDLNDLYEGAKKQITVNSYERNPQARSKCLDYYGYYCAVCNINFEIIYGSIGKNFIHVHHLKEISEIGSEYVIDPIQDLRPICPNCHSMIHQRKPCYSIDEMIDIYYHKHNDPDQKDLQETDSTHDKF